MDVGQDDGKEEVLEKLNKSEPEEEKNVETSDPKHCDNDPECVLPDLSLERGPAVHFLVTHLASSPGSNQECL